MAGLIQCAARTSTVTEQEWSSALARFLSLFDLINFRYWKKYWYWFFFNSLWHYSISNNNNGKKCYTIINNNNVSLQKIFNINNERIFNNYSITSIFNTKGLRKSVAISKHFWDWVESFWYCLSSNSGSPCMKNVQEIFNTL